MSLRTTRQAHQRAHRRPQIPHGSTRAHAEGLADRDRQLEPRIRGVERQTYLVTTDALIYTRIALGITGDAVIGGITFAANASRNIWPLIRNYLVTQCELSPVQ